MAEWERAIDPALAARLARPAVRPGLTDPSHGRALVRRYSGGQSIPLLGDLSRRYGATVLGGNRAPIVHAVQRAPDAASSPSVPTVSASPVTAPTASPGGSRDAGRPVVRAAERPAAPAFPPIRPLGAEPGAIQRSANPSAPLPVAAARRAVTPSPPVAPLADPAPRGPVVTPAASRLQRAVAADTPEPARPTRPVVTPRAAAPAASAAPASAGSGDGGGMAIQRAVDGGSDAPALVHRSAADSVAASAPAEGTIQRSAAPGESAGASGIVQRETVAGGDAPRMIHRAAAADEDDEGAAGGIIQRTPTPGESPAASGIVQRETIAGGEAPRMIHRATSGEAADAATAAPGTIQRSADPAASPATPGAAPSGTVQRATEGAASPVVSASPVRSAGLDAGATRVHRASAAGETAAGAASTASVVGRAVPVVAANPAGSAGAAAGGVIRRAPDGSGSAAAPRLVLARPAAVVAAAVQQAQAGRVQRQAVTSTPPEGAPPAEMPTVTAESGAPASAGTDVARLADQVYERLVQRLSNERRQRGW